jgi:hypothetical protein
MNERIQELLLKAGWDRYEALDERNQKFAELIVNECITAMYDNAIERKVTFDIDKTPLQYAIAVKEHFGIKG